MFRAYPVYRQGAAVVGFVTGLGIFIYEKSQQNKRRQVITQQLVNLDLQLADLKRELEVLRLPQKEKNNSVSSKSRRKLRSTSTTLSKTTSKDYSTANSDSSDLEFYDLSDDSDTERGIENELVEIDKILSDETSSDVQFALDRLNELNTKHRNRVDLLWRIAKAYQCLATQAKDIEVKKDNVFKGVQVCEKAVQIYPNLAICHKWLAILIGMRSELLSTREKITDASIFKRHLDIAISLTPDDPILHHMLGRFAFEIAQLTWFEKTMAETLFDKLPSVSLEDALQHFLEAEKLSDKEWKANRLFLAKCSLAVGKKENALDWLSKAELANSIEEDKIHEEVKNLLAKYRD